MISASEKKTRKQVLAEINAAHEKKHASATALLHNIKANRGEIEKTLNSFKKAEPDLIYRFYHQSYKAFEMTSYIRYANKLFSDLAPESTFLSSEYGKITRAGLRNFNGAATNRKWLEETLPMTQAFWQAKYFLEQMLVAADELDEAPQILPSGWAAVLYLYNVR